MLAKSATTVGFGVVFRNPRNLAGFLLIARSLTHACFEHGSLPCKNNPPMRGQ